VLGFSQLLEEDIELFNPDKIKKIVTTLRASAERLYALLENLLTWSRIQRGAMEYAPEDIDLYESVEDTVDLFTSKAKQKNLTLKNSLTEGTMVYADANMVDTVLRNLISNAIKFTPGGGAIDVSAQLHNERFFEVAVADTGTGIPPDDLAKLFRIDIQYTHVGTAGEKGTGLGLNLCKDLVEKNGGVIGVESTIEKGTIFRFTLPKAK
jgi:signal transduction histidine kinase